MLLAAMATAARRRTRGAASWLHVPAALAEPALRVAVPTVQVDRVGAGLEDTP